MKRVSRSINGLGMHERAGLAVSRFNEDVQNLQQTRHYLVALENIQGPLGKALFTASVSDSLSPQTAPIGPDCFLSMVPTDAAEPRFDR